MTKVPNFFLLGAPKCGTSAMRNYLASHPNIFFAVPDEPGYFDRQFRYSNPDDCAYRDIEDYLSIYRKVDLERELAIGEGSVYMMYSEETLREILSVSPDARFLIMMRNPFEAAISMHGENLKSLGIGREPHADFEDAWRDLGNRDTRGIAGVHPMRFRYDVLFSYAEHVSRAQELLGAERLMLVSYDNFRKDNLGVVRQVYEFLGVDPGHIPDTRIVNERSQAKDNMAAQFVAWAAIQSRKYRILRPLRGRGLTLNRFTQGVLEKPRLSSETMQGMHDVFDEDILRLQELTGFDLGDWLATDLTSHR